MEENKIDQLIFPERAHELLSWIKRGKDVTVRDDQYDFPWLIDIVKACRKRRCRFRLIDSGKLSAFELEWLGKAGADLYTSDSARPKTEELELINKACRRGGAFVAYFHQGMLGEEEEKESGLETISFFDLDKMGREGIYVYLSNRKIKRSFSQLNELAYSCQQGGCWLVYYHFGPLESSIEELARSGAWIHVSDKSVKEPQDLSLLIETLKASSSKGTRLVLHLDAEWKTHQLRDVIDAGAIVLFKSSLLDYRSPLRTLERESRRRKLDFRAYYLYPTFLP
jgi:uncharacterized protein YlbG (UPF0298 family)